jgi:sugar (pentulose or hexulose) kinase
LIRQPVILIFDIGKTAKKVLVFDRHFHVLEEQSETLRETVDDDGFPADDLPRVATWLREHYQYYINHESFEVTHCNVSAYGASLVHLDSNGEALIPFYNYLKQLPDDCAGHFMRLYNADGRILEETASPYLGMLNSGLQLFWLKHSRPAFFERIATTLHLPQYFASLLTGQQFTEITGVGCHTMLWDYATRDYHAWVKQEALDRLFPPLRATTQVTTRAEGARAIQLGVGVHDSSAALMPYLATQHERFLLLSTGTWNICFNPFNATPLTSDELAADCLCYLTYEGQPVKASRIFLGHEHELQAVRLAQHFNVDLDAYKGIRFDQELFTTLAATDAPSRPFFPIGMEGSGPLPQKAPHATDLAMFSSFAEAYHQLIRYLVQWQQLSIDLVDPERSVRDIIVVGGFTRNGLFLETLKRTCPGRRILISDHPRASALGAAWLVSGKEAYSGNEHLLSVMPYT